MAIINNKKNKKKEGNKSESELNTVEEGDETTEMDVDGLIPPEPDYPSGNQIQDQNIAPLPQPIEIPLNEEALKNLIKKEEENLAIKNNNKTKNLDEIKKDLNSLYSYINNSNNNIYEDPFFSDLKKLISK